MGLVTSLGGLCLHQVVGGSCNVLGIGFGEEAVLRVGGFLG